MLTIQYTSNTPATIKTMFTPILKLNLLTPKLIDPKTSALIIAGNAIFFKISKIEILNVFKAK